MSLPICPLCKDNIYDDDPALFDERKSMLIHDYCSICCCCGFYTPRPKMTNDNLFCGHCFDEFSKLCLRYGELSLRAPPPTPQQPRRCNRCCQRCRAYRQQYPIYFFY